MQTPSIRLGQDTQGDSLNGLRLDGTKEDANSATQHAPTLARWLASRMTRGIGSPPITVRTHDEKPGNASHCDPVRHPAYAADVCDGLGL